MQAATDRRPANKAGGISAVSAWWPPLADMKATLVLLLAATVAAAPQQETVNHNNEVQTTPDNKIAKAPQEVDLMSTIISYLNTNETAGNEEERSRRRKGLVKKVVLPVFLSAALMGAPIILGLVALAAFKGLWSGMTALGVTAALALKHLFSKHAPVYFPPTPHHYTEYFADYKRNDEFRRPDDYRQDFRFGW